MFVCKFCEKEFKSQANLMMHYDICKVKDGLYTNELQERIKILEELLKDKIIEIENKDRLIEILFRKINYSS